MAFLPVPITCWLIGHFSAAKQAANCMSSGRRQPDQLALRFQQKSTAFAQLATGNRGAQFFDDFGAQFRDVVCFPAIIGPDVEFGNG